MMKDDDEMGSPSGYLLACLKLMIMTSSVMMKIISLVTGETIEDHIIIITTYIVN